MNKKDAFTKKINEGYNSKRESIILDGAVLDGEALADTQVKIPLKTI